MTHPAPTSPDSINQPAAHDFDRAALERHRELAGKIEISAKAQVRNRTDLSLYYTPGVAAVSLHLADQPQDLPKYTWTGNTVAVVSDGSAVLGLGNIGPAGALPVMEGKAMLFKELAGVNAVPIVLSTQDPDEIITAVQAIAPSFGGINLEDIGAPQCFAVEQALVESLDIPVMHDDQHGTAIVILAGLINASKVTGKELTALRVVIVGAGAAGVAATKLLRAAGIHDIVLLDSRGILGPARVDLRGHKAEIRTTTNPREVDGGLPEALAGADVFIGVSVANLLPAKLVGTMADDPIIFALANPVPEIMPDIARRAGAAVVATGRSDFPNQVNNALGFPGIFKGALENGVRRITTEMKLAAAQALAGVVEQPTAACIIPDIFDPRVVPAVAAVIRE